MPDCPFTGYGAYDEVARPGEGPGPPRPASGHSKDGHDELNPVFLCLGVPNPNHPYGVRGVGATSVIPPLAAITNAVYHAIGIRLNRLPLSPARILEAVWEKEAAPNGAHGK